MALAVRQESTYRGNEWWDWSLWIEGPARELDRITSVTYRLHDTFPDPVQTRFDRSDKFRLDSSGWGGFTIHVQIHTRSGKTIELEHALDLSYPGTAPQKSSPGVFFSYAAADKKLGIALEHHMRNEGYTILNKSNAVTGSGWRDSISEAIKSADAVITIASDATSDYVCSELELAKKLGRPVIPVITEVAGLLPETIRDVQGIRLTRSDPVSQTAATIADRIRGMKK